jgi:hypothetical protein
VDDRRPDGPGSCDEPGDDLGRPLTELRELRESADPTFMARIRGRIHRRLFAADSVDFTSHIFFATCLDYLDLLMQSLLAWTRPAPPPPEKEPDGHGS